MRGGGGEGCSHEGLGECRGSGHMAPVGGWVFFLGVGAASAGGAHRGGSDEIRRKRCALAWVGAPGGPGRGGGGAQLKRV